MATGDRYLEPILQTTLDGLRPAAQVEPVRCRVDRVG